MRIAKIIGTTIEAGESIPDFLGRAAVAVADDFVFEGSAYTDATSAPYLEAMGLAASSFDYITMRDSMKNNVFPSWETLSFDDKKILVLYFIYPEGTNLDDYFTPDEQLQNWRALASKSLKARKTRLEITRQELSFYLATMEIADLFLTVEEYMAWFTTANFPHLVLWLTNGVNVEYGIDFSLDGFAQKPYYSDQKRDLCLNILVNGDYNNYL